VYIIVKLLPLISVPLITINLSMQDLGYIALFELCISPVYIICNFAIGTIIKSNWHQLKYDDKNSLISFLYVMCTLLSIIVILPIIIIPNQIYYTIFGNHWDALKPALPLIYLSIIFIIPKEIFNSWSLVENKISLNNKVNLFGTILNTTGIILVSLFTKNYIHVIKIYVITRMLIGFFQSFTIFLNIKFLINKHFYVKIFKNALPIYLTTILNSTTPRINSLIVSHYFSISLFAYYNISMFIYNFYNELIEHFQNSTDKFIYDNSINRISRDYIVINDIWSYFIILISVLFIPTGEKVLNNFSNGLFHDCYNFILLILCIIISNLPFVGNQQILNKNKFEKYIFTSTLLKSFITIILSILTAPKLGAKGTLISIWCGSFIFNFLILIKKYEIQKEFSVSRNVIYYVIFYHVWIVSYFLYNNPLLNIIYPIVQIYFFFMFFLRNKHKFSQII
jgi:O-antigen/teichoic acid export membrane protein